MIKYGIIIDIKLILDYGPSNQQANIYLLKFYNTYIFLGITHTS